MQDMGQSGSGCDRARGVSFGEAPGVEEQELAEDILHRPTAATSAALHNIHNVSALHLCTMSADGIVGFTSVIRVFTERNKGNVHGVALLHLAP